MNPCRCGYFNDPEQRCRCAADDAERYVRRVSGPFLDRIDIRIEMARVPALELLGGPPPEGSAAVGARIAAARALSLERNKGRPNAALPGSAAVKACGLTPALNSTLADIASTHKLSARAVHRMVRVARSIADLGGRDRAIQEDVLAAAALREPGASLDTREAA
jgi:magnesium chelatase family protein